MDVKLLGDDPHANEICRYFATAFPKVVNITASQVLEILTIVLIGDKNLRLGPVPPPEHLVVIRKTISEAIALGVPIPVLVPWGGRKLDKALSLDVAEVSALKQLLGVDEMVKKYYAPGLNISIRIEDLNAEWLYKDREGITEYSHGMLSLISMLKGDTILTGILESTMMSYASYFRTSEMYSKLLAPVIHARMEGVDIDKVAEFAKLLEAGWQGDVPKEQVDYYIDRYKVMDPGKTNEQYAAKLADYFGGSKARYDLGGRGNPTSMVTSFIQINFATPVPNAPVSLFNNTLYYRTVPTNHGRTHIAPWRSKGFLEIDVDNTVKVKVTNWGNKDLIDSLCSAQVEATDGTNKVLVSVDYLCKEFEMPFII